MPMRPLDEQLAQGSVGAFSKGFALGVDVELSMIERYVAGKRRV